MFDRAEHCRRIGAAGGRATVERHGRGHMATIGRRGFESTTRRYFHNSRDLHIWWLTRLAAWAYWRSTGLPMKRDRSGRALWPEEKPVHPAEIMPRGSELPF